MKKYIKESKITSDSKDTHTVTIKTITIECYEKNLDISDEQYNDLLTFNEDSTVYTDLEDIAENTDEFPDEQDLCYIVTDESGKWLDSYNSLENLYAVLSEYVSG